MKIKKMLLIVLFILWIQVTMVSASEIIIEDADTICNITTAYSPDLTNITSSVTTRILAEYTNTIYRNELNEISADLANLSKEVPPLIIIEYANSNYYERLIFPKELINDTTPPVITNITVTNITDNSATIEWDTDEFTDSLIKYGEVSGIYTESVEEPLFVKNHTVELTGLLLGTCYYFVVNSTDQSGNSNESIGYNFITTGELKVFDTGAPENPYPSISGTHNGTITLNQTITVSVLYTYQCAGTGGHTEYAKIWNDSDWNVTASWQGYKDDWRNISFDRKFTLEVGENYSYTLKIGSYPQIHHTDNLSTSTGVITCSEFVDTNGKRYGDRIPAIRLWAR